MNHRSGLVLALALTVVPFGLRPAAAQKEAPAIKLSETEQKFLDLTNAARTEKGLPPLKLNATLVEVARAHSRNMAKQGKMSHVLDNKGPAERVKEAGYDYATMGENVAWGKNTPVRESFQALMDSKLHRENILASKYQEIGVGVAKGENGELYYTQVFGTPRKKR